MDDETWGGSRCSELPWFLRRSRIGDLAKVEGEYGMPGLFHSLFIGKPVINGGGTVEDTVLLKNQEYWEIENLEITNTSPPCARKRWHSLLVR
jgi:hypothetical protein